jgi:hypothetical protein
MSSGKTTSVGTPGFMFGTTSSCMMQRIAVRHVS